MEILGDQKIARLLTRRLWLLALSLYALMAVGELSAQGFREDQVKAAFIYNFAQFTEWPPDVFQQTNAPLFIGILGTNPFGEALEQTVRNEKVRGHPVLVKYCRTLAEAEKCHIVYISSSEAGSIEEIVADLKGKPVLTVSDIENAAYRGVIIRLMTERNRVRFRINLEAARAARLTLSSKLVNLAHSIIGREKQ